MTHTAPHATAFRIQHSALQEADAVTNLRHPAGEPILFKVTRGQTLRIVDLEGNQAADVLFCNANDVAEHYSATDTLLRQRGIYLTTGSVLYSNEGQPMLTIVADTCGRHDTLGGACAAESNTVRYALQKKFMHSCRDNYLLAIQHADVGLGKADLVPNINFFMNVPVDADGTLGIVDGLSAPGKRLALRAEIDSLVLISNCPQINNPCNGFDPTPVRLIVTRPDS